MSNEGAAIQPIEGTTERIEANFKRMMSAIEAESSRIRRAEKKVTQEREGKIAEMERLRQDTDDWCSKERAKIDAEWNRLDKISEKMAGFWPARTVEVIDINCSGHLFSVPRSTLCSIEGSTFSKMFDEDFVGEVPRDEQGRLMLDFNHKCFGILVDYLQNRRLSMNAPLPIIPVGLQHSMELLAEAWNLIPFLHVNTILPVHATSLRVDGNIVKAMHPGWQLISSQYPLPLSIPSYFEVKVLCNPDPRGGLAVGVCGHLPCGAEVHSIRPQGSVLYNSNNGLIGDCVDGAEDVSRGVQLLAGSTLGVRHDACSHSFTWYHDGARLGECVLKPDCLESMCSIYPVFALFVPEQAIQVDFHAVCPADALDQDGMGVAGATLP